MDFPCCPICELPVPGPELEWHANSHFEDEELSRDLELAKQLALAPCSPLKSRDKYDVNVQLECDQFLNGYEYDPTPAAVPSSSTNSCRLNHDPAEVQDMDEHISRLTRFQCRAPFHKVGDGLLNLLRKCLELEAINSTNILSGYIDHFQSTKSEDAGWGCGWRNIQMASSYLLMHRPEAKDVLFGGCDFVPDIASLQRWLEVAWKKGFDVVGASHFGGRICGTKKWIGTTECAGLFRSFGLKARVVDFDGKAASSNSKQQIYGPMDKFAKRSRLTCVDNSHDHDDSLANKNKGYQSLVDWVWNYFSDGSPTHSVKQRVCVTNKMPLYFQHDGHSRTIVGIQVNQQKNGVKHYNLLIFDPGHRTAELERSLKANAGWQILIKRGVHTLKKPQYQLCYVESGIAHGEELEQLKTIDSTLLKC